MIRKVLRIGDCSLGISLPKRWVLHQHLQPGMEIECIVNDQECRIFPHGGAEGKKREITVDVTSLDRASVVYLAQGLYRSGYDEITFIFKKDTTEYLRTGKRITFIEIFNYLSSRFIGFEIVSQKPDRCTMKSFGGSGGEEFHQTFKKLFSMIIEIADNFFMAVKSGNRAQLQSARDHHDTITKFTSYCLRVLNQQRFSGNEVLAYTRILMEFEAIIDILKHSGITESKMSASYAAQSVELVGMILSVLNEYHDLFFHFSQEKIKSISARREAVRTAIAEAHGSIPCHELVFLVRMQQIPERIMGLVEARTSLESD